MYDSINILLIGVGPNANRLYLPAIHRLSQNTPVKLKGIVDVADQKDAVISRLARHSYDVDAIEMLFVDDALDKNYNTSDANLAMLNSIVEKQAINAVIISTEPMAHRTYALWALKHNLPILMDKPITARRNTAHSVEEAASLYTDYQELLQAYKSSQAPVFSVSVQRRFNPGFQLVLNKVQEIKNKYGIPVTSIQSLHADGQWRLPAEIISQKYHPYNIYGKVSHSGYHFLDVIAQLIKIGFHDKPFDELGIFSSFVEPRGLLSQFDQDGYRKIFGESYTETSPFTNEQLHQQFGGFGEVDASSIIQLIKNNQTVANVSLNLLHNSFSRRSWLTPGKDLYKGNGRVKHEYHNIEQGPFQNIQVHSYQKNDKHDTTTLDDYSLGGNNHFEIYVFRNKDITGDSQALETYSVKDLLPEKYDTNDYVHDLIKQEMVDEFVGFLLGSVNKTNLKSPIEDHELSVLLMSLMYQSAAKKQHLTYPVEQRIITGN